MLLLTPPYTGTTLFGSQTPNVSGFTTALDIKNPFGGVVSTTKKSFFGVDVQRDGSNVKQTTQENLDSVRTACTIEAIIRPFRGDSIIYFRRLTINVNDTTIPADTQNNFMKLELTNSPDGTQPAFRFSIRTITDDGDFTSDFAQSNVQASGLFIPNDVGINLFDGKFSSYRSDLGYL